MNIRHIFALLALTSTAYAQKPYINQEGQSTVVPMALIAPSGNPPTGNAWTPRALLVDPTTGALRVSSGSGASAGQVQGVAADGAAVTGNPVLQGGTDGTNAQTITTDASGNQIVVGNVGSGVADSGSPVKIGGVYVASPSAVSTGQRRDVSLDSLGQLRVAIYANNNNSPVALQSSSDGISTLIGLVTHAQNMSFNGGTWDLRRNNTSVSLLASAARTTTQTSADQTNYNSRALHVIWNITAHGGGTGATLSIQGKDAAGIYYTLLTGIAETTTGTKVYKIGPGITATANAAASDFVPRIFRVVVTAGDATSITYSLSYNLIN